ncbi:hypothetical protein COL84_30215, partial [Bacillus pseudomycoides]
LLKVRTFYNLAKVYSEMKEYKKSMENIEKGIQTSISNQSLYLLGELYYAKGYAYTCINQREKALDNLRTAQFVFSIQKIDNYKSLQDHSIMEQQFFIH